MKTSVSVEIDGPIEAVWAEAVDFASHHEWMGDALAIDFETDQQTGVGTVMLVETRVGPLRTVDRFTITELDAPHLVKGIHDGAVSGSAQWHITESNGSTTLAWHEQLRFPWYFAGRLGEFVAKPIMIAMWRANLRRLKSRVESRL